MDKLTEAAQAHGEIFESMTFFKKAMAVVSNQKTPDDIKELNKFFDSHIVAHFQFEEKEIFPFVLTNGTPEEKHLIRSLQQEHIRLFDKLDQFKDLISKLDSHPEEDEVNKLASLSKEIIEMTLKHGRKEDDELFPLLKERSYDFG